MAKSTLITCKACGNEIARNAKVCPHCGAKNKKPIYKRAWFIILVLFVLIGIFGGGSKSSSNETVKVGEVSSNEESTSSAAVKEEVKTNYAVGDILQDGDMKIVYVASGDYYSDNQFLQPKDGNKYIFLKFAFENSGKNDNGISFYSFECYADGYACEMFYSGEEELSATLSAGRSTEGCVYFEVPKDAEEIEVEYETNVFTSKKIKFIFEGNNNSGYTLPKNTTSTDGAYSVGDVIEGNGLTVKYLDCRKYNSTNPFIQPKDGNHYIQLEFEFENTSSADKFISSFDFYCYSDGKACDSKYLTDDDISATLSPGRKAKGSVTFEVPDDSETVEVEYEDNIWTSNKIVFKAD